MLNIKKYFVLTILGIFIKPDKNRFRYFVCDIRDWNSPFIP